VTTTSVVAWGESNQQANPLAMLPQPQPSGWPQPTAGVPMAQHLQQSFELPPMAHSVQQQQQQQQPHFMTQQPGQPLVPLQQPLQQPQFAQQYPAATAPPPQALSQYPPQALSQYPAATAPPQALSPEPWTRHTDGSRVWFSNSSGVSTWELPPGAVCTN
jgi:hypothetical protein